MQAFVSLPAAENCTKVIHLICENINSQVSEQKQNYTNANGALQVTRCYIPLSNTNNKGMCHWIHLGVSNI